MQCVAVHCVVVQRAHSQDVVAQRGVAAVIKGRVLKKARTAGKWIIVVR